MTKQIPLVCIVGPTASGKSSLAVELAKRFDAEIVSADSMQIYRGMDILTAKATVPEMQGIPHHLLDFLDLDSDYSVADYVEDASCVIGDIYDRGKLPFLVGGTGLYISSLIDHVKYADIPCCTSLRDELNRRAQLEGTLSLWHELQTIDPVTAQKLHPNDQKRIVRAIEIYRLSNKTKSEWDELSKTEPSPYRIFQIGLTAQREFLYERINRRVDQMIDNGLVQEALQIYQKCPESKTAGQAIGYKELLPYFKGECSWEEAIQRIKQETRRYAKRQLSWFKRDQRIRWVDCAQTIDVQQLADEIKDYFRMESR